MKVFAIIGIVVTVCAVLFLMRYIALKRDRSRGK
jgi:hypothetical protein